MQVQFGYEATIPTGFTVGKWYEVIRNLSDRYRVLDDSGHASYIYKSEVSGVKYD